MSAVANLNLPDAQGHFGPYGGRYVPETLMHPLKELEEEDVYKRQLRMHCRRLTRLTNAYSKKFENFQAAVALNFAYYNFCKTHNSLRMTPAQAAGVESSAWTVAQLIERCGE